MRADADGLQPHQPQQSACVPQHQGEAEGGGRGGCGARVVLHGRQGADLSSVERPFPDMYEALELVRLLRRATGNPTAVFKSPYQMACSYQAVTGSHEMTIVLPTGACARVWWMRGGKVSIK